ncbi:MAG: sporulation protein YunB, partial [Bacilli bacterium]
MKNKINLIHQQRKSKKKILILSLIGIALSTSILIFYISSNIWPVLMHYAKVDAKYIVTEIMNQAVKNKIPSQLQKQELFKTSKDERGIITMIDFNPVVINQLLTFTNQLVRDNLKALENGDVVFLKKSDIILDNALFKKIKKGLVSKIPMGTVTNNVLLSNLGPKIPVKIHFIGNVTSSV